MPKRDAKRARRGPRRRQANRTTGLVQGEASHRSGRQTEYRRKAGRRNNVDMGDNGLRLDGIRGEMITNAAVNLPTIDLLILWK